MSTKAATRHTTANTPATVKRSTAAVPAEARSKKPTIASKSKPAAPSHRRGTAAQDTALFHHMHTLLHTMQTIQQHEEQLCSMTNEIRKSGRISAALRRDLLDLLHQLPAAEYQNGIDQIYDELDAA